MKAGNILSSIIQHTNSTSFSKQQELDPLTTRQILFICTGNYYRSRYAELYFNGLASSLSLPWQAVSRGLATEVSMNIGPVAPRVLTHLKKHGIIISEDQIRYPVQLTQADLENAEIAIALYEPEHYLLMQERFPEWADRIDYWHIPDLNETPSNVAFPKIDHQVTRLLHHLPV